MRSHPHRGKSSKQSLRLEGQPSHQWYGRDESDRKGPWEFTLCGELSDKQGELINSLTDVPRGSRGILYFDSCGGSVYAGLAVATLIRLRRLQVTGVVIGECSSAALLSFSACKRRFVTHQSTLLFHPMRWQSEEDVKLEEATEWARHFKLLENSLDDVLVRMFGILREKLHLWTRPGRFVTGPELAEAGLATLIDAFEDEDCWKQLTGG
ncbi:MAG: ATP-dependent Clp protease proteolytic subunit [Planctomycetaceae bacterium]